MNVSNAKAKDQVLEVLHFFNVKVTEGDIFSRCQVRPILSVVTVLVAS